jgi:hypothetical protein
LYIADLLNSRIRKVTVSTGVISTYVGTGTASYSGDNSQASSATLCYPSGVALDATGTNIYFIIFIYVLTYTSFYQVVCICSSRIVVITVSAR